MRLLRLYIYLAVKPGINNIFRVVIIDYLLKRSRGSTVYRV